jgi:hypothetical protein
VVDGLVDDVLAEPRLAGAAQADIVVLRSKSLETFCTSPSSS